MVHNAFATCKTKTGLYGIQANQFENCCIPKDHTPNTSSSGSDQTARMRAVWSVHEHVPLLFVYA